MAYNPDRGGFETIDGGLIRIQDKNDDGNVRISIYDGDERDIHDRTTINIDTNSGSGSIDYHNEDKSESSSTDTSCFLTTACMKHFHKQFDDNCYELKVLRWFRDKFVSKEDIEHYYEIAPIIIENINKLDNCNELYNEIYENVILLCVKAIENSKYNLAYSIYKNSILNLEEEYARPALQQKLVRVLSARRNIITK